MGFVTKVTGMQFAIPEGYTLGTSFHTEHEAPMSFGKKDYPSPVGIYDENNVRIGYWPEADKAKFNTKMKQIAYESSVLGIQLNGVLVEGKWKDEEGWNNEGRGELLGADISFDWPYDNGVDSTHYHREGKSFQRLTGLLSRVEWEKGKNEGLDKWKIGAHRDFKAYQTAMSYYAMDGSLLHLKAELLANGETLPNNVEFPDRVQYWLDALQPEFIGTEDTVFDHDLGIAGTYDGLTTFTAHPIARYNNKKTVIDWKRSRQCHVLEDERITASESYYFQAAFYAKHAGAEQVMVVPFGITKFLPHKLYIMELDEINKRYEAVCLMKHMIDIAEEVKHV